MKIIKPLLFYLIYGGAIVLFFAFGYLCLETYKLYKSLSKEGRGYESPMYQSDSTLGFKPIPNTRGFLSLYPGDTTPVYFDEQGFRVPIHKEKTFQDASNVDILFLGCSISFGYGCRAEHTFAHLTSEKLNYTYINAGMNAYGLTQMYLLAQKLIPKYKPKIVVFQHSPWLVYRGINMFSNSVDKALISMPYFSDSNSEEIVINPPLENASFFNFQKAIIKGQVNLSTFLKFYSTGGAGYSSIKMLKRLKGYANTLFKQPLISSDKAPQLERKVFQKLIEFSKKNGSLPVILNIGFIRNDANQLSFSDSKHIIFVNADSVLKTHLSISPEQDTSENAYEDAYFKAYGHWKKTGEDSVLVDTHPNEKAHYLISRIIIDSIQHK